MPGCTCPDTNNGAHAHGEGHTMKTTIGRRKLHYIDLLPLVIVSVFVQLFNVWVPGSGFKDPDSVSLFVIQLIDKLFVSWEGIGIEIGL
jgi:hypothetical protein